MVDRSNFISCNRYKEGCKFSINRTICKKKITDTQVKALLEKGKTALIKGFVSKKDTKFDAMTNANRITKTYFRKYSAELNKFTIIKRQQKAGIIPLQI